jgi:hypothetical protein
MLHMLRPIFAAACCVLVTLPAQPAAADEAEDQGVERCISLNRISRTEVLDDHNILFYMRGGKIYRNQLPHRCPGLRRQQPFMYRTSLSQLCDLDVVTVLHDHSFGFTPGASCGLGRFYPITKEEIKALKEAGPEITPEEVPTAEPEELGRTE